MGSAKNIPSEGGSGGKRGHSNMEHWFFTAEIKDAARVRRRQDDKRQAREAVGDFARDRDGGPGGGDHTA